ncbi:VCBS repeat-containing protein [Streptomyces sp. VRA16 Mangrove soil]|uniref:FG-GAP repeat domain-containing protein n=1 Tax=Streptomyces sp. VRA16 Mangrove soil TaxID=2817434 RepID=UPI001A9DE6EA|nr:VCBS repeat-containing protein [Streptomyces sp. VRA16 Mangrove soil]MBO1335619.1 VCBS repeat-containing protein [Streptomyces sp. VRA16 Mangrove soil]
MKSRRRGPLLALSLGAVLSLVAGCGGAATDTKSPSPSRSSAADAPRAPRESRAPEAGKGSRDPDDLNGDGHPDLLLTVSTLPAGAEPDQSGSDQRVAVVYGSAHGLDPTTRAVYERADFGLPARDPQAAGSAWSISTDDLVTGDLDGDGYPDFVNQVAGERATDGHVIGQRIAPYVSWGSPTGPVRGTRATPVRLPAAARLGVSTPVRGDFDGDGHLDLAGLNAGERPVVWLLYGPFDRSTGAPARTASLPAVAGGGGLSADAVDPEHPRRTGLLVRRTSDGEQEDGIWYADVRTGRGRTLRKGNAHAFGDFDGDGVRDLAIGDDGGRNDEPGYETEAPDVDGSLAVYPGDGGAPVPYRLPAPGPARGSFRAADPDGDGRDGLLVTGGTGGVTLIDGETRTRTGRQGPARWAGKKVPAAARAAHVVTVADFDGDGKDEVVWAWGRHGSGDATHWWVARGTSSKDETSFLTTGFAR